MIVGKHNNKCLSFTDRLSLNTYVIFFLLVFITGCATTEYPKLPDDSSSSRIEKPLVQRKDGIYHKVEKGQTLWRIAKSYNLTIDDIIIANNIPNAAAIEVNQLIFIPQAKEIQQVPTALTTTTTTQVSNDDFIWPLQGKLLSYFNDKKHDSVNKGIDIQTQVRDAVKATRSGKVILSDYIGSWGYTVMLDHGDGFISLYAQQAQNLVRLGDDVIQGQTIAQMGDNGRGMLLHFQLRKGAIAVNPLYYLP